MASVSHQALLAAIAVAPPSGELPATHRASSTFGAPSNVTTMTIAKPSGTADGDVMFFSCVFENSISPWVISPASLGWTLVAENLAANPSYAVYRKIASSEPADYTFTWTTTRRAAAQINGFYDATFDVAGAATTNATTSYGAGGVTVANAASTLLYIALNKGTSITFTEPSGFTEQVDFQNGAAVCCLTAATKSSVAAGATGTITGTLSSSAAGIAILISLY